jgi:hypothetical protein
MMGRVEYSDLNVFPKVHLQCSSIGKWDLTEIIRSMNELMLLMWEGVSYHESGFVIK